VELYPELKILCEWFVDCVSLHYLKLWLGSGHDGESNKEPSQIGCSFYQTFRVIIPLVRMGAVHVDPSGLHSSVLTDQFADVELVQGAWVLWNVCKEDIGLPSSLLAPDSHGYLVVQNREEDGKQELGVEGWVLISANTRHEHKSVNSS
jgi:hypothetical protein